MADLVSQISRKLSDKCLTNRCSKEGCSVPLNQAPAPFILIDMDSPQAPVDQNKRRCDYIFIGGSSSIWLVPMELKKGRPQASEAKGQLQAGANVADAHIIPRGEQVDFLPVVAHGGELRRAEHRRFLTNANRVRFRDQQVRISLMRCGKPLHETLSKASKSR